jgi:hypothetical protein
VTGRLGLAIAMELARRMGGTMQLAEAAAMARRGRRAIMELRLPRLLSAPLLTLVSFARRTSNLQFRICGGDGNEDGLANYSWRWAASQPRFF